jgi:hypothetical protein
MKEITLKEWSAYLPYGLICEVKDQGEIKTDTLSGVYDNKELVFHNIVESHQGFESVKPILYDSSWLTREITHEGETFIPLYKLQKIDKAFVLTFIETFGYEELKVEVFELLLEWRFNVFSIPNELIVRVSEDFNPYK